VRIDDKSIGRHWSEAGIGRAIALALGREGSAVVVNDVDSSSGKRTVRDIERWAAEPPS